jgi:hypothetical protein
LDCCPSYSSFLPLVFDKKIRRLDHLELGAGNYGPDGHTQSSQQMTVLMKLKTVSKVKNYIDELEAKGKGDYKAEDQYRVLSAL